MNEPDAIKVPVQALDRIIEEVRTFGLRHLETGGFFMMARNTATVSIVACAGDVGIVRRDNLFQISERALDRLFTFADEGGLWAPVQFHSHPGRAFLSRADKEHGLCAEGFISVVIPTFGDPPRDITHWGWWRFDGGRWVTATPASTGPCDVRTVWFDEDGFREH
jgi:proteasome lid subunit RPN8/RPN11